jgi:sensor histidine kinase YesM
MGKKILYHALFWIGYRSYGTLFMHLKYPDYKIYFWDVFFYESTLIGVFYSVTLVILPTLLPSRKFALLLASLLLLFFAYASIRYALIYPLQPYLNPEDIKPPFEIRYFLLSAGWLFSEFVIYGFGYWYANKTIRQEREKRIMEEQKRKAEEEKNAFAQDALQSELAFLKSQFNPHFLYNTLNYFYSTAYEYSEELAEGILKLSNIMRYSLRESPDSRVPLPEEVHYLQNFIDIHQLRFSHKLNIDFQVTGELMHKRILPLVLISFVENAFKYGNLTDAQSPLMIHVSVSDEKICFFIKNKKNRSNGITSTKIGLANVKRRLDLAYKQDYQLDIQEDDKYYTCQLLIHI